MANGSSVRVWAVFGCFWTLGAGTWAADRGDAWREHESRSVGLRFDVPAGAQVYERLIYTDASQPSTVSVRSLRVVPAGVSEERSLGGPTYVSVYVHELVAGQDPAAWLARLCSNHPGVQGQPPREVAGVPATIERLSQAEGPSLQASFVLGRRVVRIESGPRSEGRRAFERVLQSLATTSAEPAQPAAEPSASTEEPTVTPVVRMVYLVPSDRVLQSGYGVGLERAIRHLQVFYRQQIANGKTFLLNTPVVEVVYTGHPVSWYTTQHPGNGDFWNYVLADGFAALGGGFNDPNNRWIFYIDADQLCNQVVGGTSGVALMPANDLRGLLCQGNIPPCGGNPDNGGVCRWVGGGGHEMGHAFNLPHPPGCDAGSCACPAPNTSCSTALMWSGYASFPNAYLLPSDVTSLVTSPQTAQFFTLFDPGALANPCTSGCPPTIHVVSPNGGETWSSGSVHPVTWTASGLNPVGSLQIFWSPDAGANWNFMASVAQGTTMYGWTVPAQLTGAAVVFVGNAVSGVWEATDQSDQPFSVVSDLIFANGFE